MLQVGRHVGLYALLRFQWGQRIFVKCVYHQLVQLLGPAHVQMEARLPVLAYVTPSEGDGEGASRVTVKEVAVPYFTRLEIGLAEEGIAGGLHLRHCGFARA